MINFCDARAELFVRLVHCYKDLAAALWNIFFELLNFSTPTATRAPTQNWRQCVCTLPQFLKNTKIHP